MQFEMTKSLEPGEYKALLVQQTAWEYLGYREVQPEQDMLEELRECEALLLQAVQPAFTCELVRVAEWTEQSVELNWREPCRILSGTSIAKHLENCTHVLCAALTLGAGVDELIDRLQQESMLRALLTDALANAMVEGLRMLVEQTLLQKLPKAKKNWLFGIGYGDLSIELQPAFLEAIGAKERIGLQSNTKGVLVPMKSVTGFLGVTVSEQSLPEENAGNGCGRKSCAECDNQACVKRREGAVSGIREKMPQVVDKNK